MKNYIREIVYVEGYQAYHWRLRVKDNPYEGVSKELQTMWSIGWWDARSEDQ